MLSIGELARASGLSVSALRFYDKAGVLTPHVVDPRTGYRWYADRHVDAAVLVAAMRGVGVPVKDMAAVLSGTDAHGLLDRHLGRLEKGLDDARRELRKIHRLLDAPHVADEIAEREEAVDEERVREPGCGRAEPRQPEDDQHRAADPAHRELDEEQHAAEVAIHADPSQEVFVRGECLAHQADWVQRIDGIADREIGRDRDEQDDRLWPQQLDQCSRHLAVQPIATSRAVAVCKVIRFSRQSAAICRKAASSSTSLVEVMRSPAQNSLGRDCTCRG